MTVELEIHLFNVRGSESESEVSNLNKVLSDSRICIPQFFTWVMHIPPEHRYRMNEIRANPDG